jgi:3'-phosphoadenosine 5'-phosphosulfate sulfotransferase (PAPS reductase)/FAD synthetase
MKRQKHIVSFSGGKDSTAMLLRMIELDMPIDKIIFADTTLEYPELYDYIKKVEKYIKRKITIVKPEYDLDHYFYKKDKGFSFCDYSLLDSKRYESKSYGETTIC